MTIADRLPTFPWDTLAAARERAQSHPEGFIDLTVGSPVDPAPQVAIEALTRSSDAHGYPRVVGISDLQDAMGAYLRDRWRVTTEVGTLPVIGTKEFVAWLPTHLGLAGAADTVVVHPETAYPTYAVGAQLAGIDPVACDDPAVLDDRLAGRRAGLVWINSPANPHGAILSADELRAWVAWCREHGAVLASDECYGEFGWEDEPVSVLDPSITDDPTGVLAIFSESKRSNLAGYRAGFCAGDVGLISQLTEIRKHGGMMMPTPVQAAMAATLVEHRHVVEQKARYRDRRDTLRQALLADGWRIDHSEGGLYLWATRGDFTDGRAIVDHFAALGILVTPGDFYGDATHVRITLTATDDDIAGAAGRIVRNV
ncbi:succinyldiaminopimelate transaminase [Propioniferax innocua]|uniref:Succinyldiaminopimelate aminotransferase n=1 Tax=Propioniferax innocua TaxID=1753 RepID=A0A542ZRH7_9ACTN|nr:succinyldiaminopimelate transaminase [Propioniferax innocua]TQL62927.1 succinyldiaminopimelate aminotransferase [Propioniferax innocua]